jgi:quercetin dioxygenase-like cupin family protein
MASLTKRSFSAPDERRTPPNATMEIVRIGDRTVTRVTYQPGWRWSVHAKPVVGGELCQVNHFGYVISGRMHAQMPDGTEIDMGPGDVGMVPAGHDGWVVGDEPCVFVDFGM